MKNLGKSRGHMQPRKQSRRIPACIIKHSTLSYDRKDIGILKPTRRRSKT